jgi:DNA-binding transcriptional LysR family regulator
MTRPTPSTELPSLESLRCFVEAARASSFRGAARVVHLTPAAVGQRVRQLEDQLGTPLFVRTTRHMELTARGLALLPVAREALEVAARCHVVASGEAQAFGGDLVLGTRHELGMSWLHPLLPKLAREQPALTVHLYFGSGPDLVARVATREVDCAITSSRLSDPALDAVKLHEETYAFVASPKLLAKTPLTRPEHAREHELFDVSAELPLYRYFRDAPGGLDSMRFGKVVRLGTIDAIRASLLGDRGVAVLPTYFVRDALAKKRLVRLFPKVKPLADHFRLVFRANDARRPLYQWLGARLAREPLR